MTVHKKHTEHKTQETSDKKQVTSNKKKETQSEPVVVSDTITETTERIEVVEEVVPQEETKTTAESMPAKDPLTDFKEKMIEEEMPAFNSAQKKNYMWPILFIFVIALLLLAGVFLYRNGINFGEKTEINVVTLSPTPTVVPQPTKAIDLSKYEVKVLNGSEVDGEAGRQKDNLEKEGFIVSAVGNADTSDYTDTIIQAKEGVDKDFLDKLKSVLEVSFTADNEVLPDTAATPIVVILGTKK